MILAFDIKNLFKGIFDSSGFAAMGWQQALMIVIACIFLFLGIAKKFEPLLLVGIAFGMLLTNLPVPQGAEKIFHPEFWNTAEAINYGKVLTEGGLLDILYIGVKTGVYPSLIFLGVGAMTDFSPLIANPKALILGAAAQFGIFIAFVLAITFGFPANQAASIGIIGGADGPTAIWLSKTLAPELLGPIAIAAYSYMALIPMIQPPLARMLLTKKERSIKMETLRTVTKREKIIFPIMITIFTCLMLPAITPLLGCLMLGNLFRETGVTERLSDTAQNAMMNIVTIFLGISVGATAHYTTFLKTDTLLIIALGLFAFIFSTIGGLLMGKIMCAASKGKINPLIGAAGVSAVPMAARVANIEGRKANPQNFLLMHAMGPNVAGVIGSAVAAGILLSIFM
ncbi:MAG TPA: sodium ion-translocating decarboxylase subunit beta [Clostridiales bacterium]|nr:sodium ion-translocating decarboxylase subunit beta [Clostridiales bacterium]